MFILQEIIILKQVVERVQSTWTIIWCSLPPADHTRNGQTYSSGLQVKVLWLKTSDFWLKNFWLKTSS